MPPAFNESAINSGFWANEVKNDGPVHWKVPLPSKLVVMRTVSPKQTGLLLVTVVVQGKHPSGATNNSEAVQLVLAKNVAMRFSVAPFEDNPLMVKFVWPVKGPFISTFCSPTEMLSTFAEGGLNVHTWPDTLYKLVNVSQDEGVTDKPEIKHGATKLQLKVPIPPF